MTFDPNSKLMYIMVAIVLLYVTAQAVFFLVKAIKRAKELNISSSTVKKTILSSAVFSIAPAISILMGVLTMAGFLGLPFPWLRLSILGALTYEVTAASSAAKSLGITDLSTLVTDPKVFATMAWVMHLGIFTGLILVPLFLKKIQRGLIKIKERDEKWSDAFLTALFLGMISAFLGLIFADIKSGLAGWIPVFVMVVSALIMSVLGILVKKFKIKWLEDFALPITMLVSMALSIPITNLIESLI
ncbi:MAG TPA: DUF5058 family protein [Clostridia bacterium]|jgi:hypothetical protein|nr:MAG: hypothetical protein BWX78_00477 [Firmicutes bacterium ADurb.Bin099]HNZ41152.1 DUF5058 family protein [Clostridia bacterium]HPY98754.1 DUF5058 family protein [Clostridia bacterium]HQC68690.1 DUF5058 family protein [Clostridia bacterium]